MNIPQNVQKLLNEQFYNELYAAHLYFAMSAFFKRSPYQGFASWFRLQAKEEMEHAMKIYDYLCDRDAPFSPAELAKPSKDKFESPLEAYKAALAHEELVTGQINKIFEVANDEKDWATADFINWYIKEQTEEEHQVKQFISALEFAGDDKKLLFAVNEWAGKRS